MEKMNVIHCNDCGEQALKIHSFTCNHNYCSLCILSRIFKKHLIEIQNCESVEIKCKCKGGALTMNFSEIDKLVDSLWIFTEGNDAHCLEHNIEVSSYCLQCKKWICPLCFLSHNSSHILKECAPGECQIHKNKLIELYCVDCKATVCILCTIPGSIHHGHRYELLEDYDERLRVKLREVKKKFGSFHDFSVHLDTLYTRYKDKYNSATMCLENLIDDIIEQMLKLKANFLEQIKKCLYREEIIMKIVKTVYLHAFSNIIKSESLGTSKLKFLSQLTWDLSNLKYVENNEIENDLKNILANVAIANKNLTSQGFSHFSKEFAIFKTIIAHSQGVTSLISLKDGRYASGSKDNSVKIWNNDHQCKQTLNGHLRPVLSLAYLKNGGIATGSEDTLIKLWTDPSSSIFLCHQTLQGHSGGVITLLQLKDLRLVSGSFDSSIQIWSEKQNLFTCTQVIYGHGGLLTSGAVFKIIELSDGRLASGSDDKTIKIWTNLNNQFKCTQTLQGHGGFWSNGGVLSLMQIKDNRLVSGSKDYSIRIWLEKAKLFEVSQTLLGHEDEVCCLAEMKDGRFASGSEDKTLRIWTDSHSGFYCSQILNGHQMGVFSLLRLKNGTLISASGDRSIRIWDEKH